MTSRIRQCRICQGKRITAFLDFGRSPLANALLERADEKEERYPLALARCRDCGLIQLTHTVDPKRLFAKYIWVTGTSGAARAFAARFSDELIRRAKRPAPAFVLEVASNDGTFLVPFMEKGYRALGIDPARNVVNMATQAGVPTECAFFGENAAKRIVKKHGVADMIFARNVLAHVADTRDFVRGLATALAPGGTLAVEVHYGGKILEGLQYDSIYHEHLCYLTLKAVERAFAGAGLTAFDAMIGPISGGALIVFAKKEPAKATAALRRLRAAEARMGVNRAAPWQAFARRVRAHRTAFVGVLDRLVASKTPVAGYGASARSATLLNFSRIDRRKIPLIADLNPMKNGKFAPGSHIPIVSPQVMMETSPGAIILLAWNFAEEIKKYLKDELGYKGAFVLPLPDKPKIIYGTDGKH